MRRREHVQARGLGAVGRPPLRACTPRPSLRLIHWGLCRTRSVHQELGRPRRPSAVSDRDSCTPVRASGMRVRTQGGPRAGGDTGAALAVCVGPVGVSQVLPAAAGPGLAGDGQGGRLGNVASGFPWPTQVEVRRARPAGEKSDRVTGVCGIGGRGPRFHLGVWR